jgi:hypothetical protein
MNNDHISSSEILDDIRDTEREILTMEREAKGFRLIGDKLSIMKACQRDIGIQDRLEFITRLRGILNERGNNE